MAVDFEKEFDKVEWDSMYCILEAYNFCPEFIKLVKICYTDIRAAVLGFLDQNF